MSTWPPGYCFHCSIVSHTDPSVRGPLSLGRCSASGSPDSCSRHSQSIAERLPDQHQSSPVLAGPIRRPGHAVLWLDAGQADSWAFRDMADDCCSGLGSLRRCNSNTTSSCAAAAYQLYSTRYCLRNSYTYCLQTSRCTFDLLR